MDTCPFCAEDLPHAAERCPSCGERMGEIEHRPAGIPVWAIILLVIAVIALLLCVVGGFMSYFMMQTMPLVPPPPVSIQTRPTLPIAPRSGATDALVAALPLQTGPFRLFGGVNRADRETYSWGGYGITEIGRVRLAVRGVTFRGRSSGGLIVDVRGSLAGGGGSTGSGARRFTHQTQNGVTTCTFGGLTFTIQGGKLTLGKIKLNILGASTQVLLVDADGGNPVVLPGP